MGSTKSECNECSCDELADTTGSLDSSFGHAGELLGSDDASNGGEGTRSEDLEEALKRSVII